MVTVDYGTAIPVVVPDSTTVQYATLTKSYRGGWRSDTVDVVQGVYSDYGYSSSLSWNLWLHVVWQSAQRALRHVA